MSSEQLVSTNQCHPYELHAALLVEEILQRRSFPFKRISVEVTFSPTITTFAKHKNSIEMNGKRAEGKVTLIYNSLFLMQDPMSFFEQAVPHEVAHVLNELTAFAKGMEVQEHGLEWQDILGEISATAMPAASLPDCEFDVRPITLQAGGVLAECQCEGDERFHAYRNTGAKVGALRQGVEECPQCGSLLQITDINAMSVGLRADLEFIQHNLRERSA